MTTTRKRATKNAAPEFPTAEQISAQVHEHHAEERRDDAARQALTALARKLSDARTDPEPDMEAAFAEARVSGDWQTYEAAYLEHLDWQERQTRRTRISNDLSRRAVNANPGERARHRAEAGRATLDYLAEVLPGILDAAQSADPQMVPASAEAAVNADPEAVTRYQHARSIVDAYAALRRAQAQAVRDVAVVEAGSAHDFDVWKNGQYRDALHLDAAHLSARRNAIGMLKKDDARRYVRKYARGAVEFFDRAPQPVMDPLGDEGFPAGVNTVRARLAWLGKWSARLEFYVPTFEQLREVTRVYNLATDVRSWKPNHGLVIEDDGTGRPLPENARALEIANLDYQRPDWGAPQGDTEAEVADAAEANRRAARASEHPGYAA